MNPHHFLVIYTTFNYSACPANKTYERKGSLPFKEL